MGSGYGDRLARGNASATFLPTHKDVEITLRKERPAVWGECKNCPRKFYSAHEFTEHLNQCATT